MTYTATARLLHHRQRGPRVKNQNWEKRTPASRLLCRAPLHVAMFATCIIVISAVSGHADTVLLKGSSKGSTEGYFGSAISANQDKVVFDIECSGKKVELFWSKGLTDLTFNKTCKPQGALGAGGFDLDCSKVFMIIDNALEAEVFTHKITYSTGIVTFN